LYCQRAKLLWILRLILPNSHKLKILLISRLKQRLTPLDHSQFRLLFDLEQLTKDYPEVFANVNIAASELAIKEITPGKGFVGN